MQREQRQVGQRQSAEGDVLEGADAKEAANE
jgi:hypothetical protein